jgi:hypothetical protein
MYLIPSAPKAPLIPKAACFWIIVEGHSSSLRTGGAAVVIPEIIALSARRAGDLQKNPRAKKRKHTRTRSAEAAQRGSMEVNTQGVGGHS